MSMTVGLKMANKIDNIADPALVAQWLSLSFVKSEVRVRFPSEHIQSADWPTALVKFR